MYELRDLAALQGQRIHFLWQRDEDSDGPVLGFFRDLGSGVSQAADAVAGAVEAVVNAVEEVVTDVIETVATAARSLFDWLGGALSGIPLIGGALQAVFHWIGGVIGGFLDLVASLVKAILGIVGGVVAGVVRLVGGAIGGLLSWDGRTFVKGFNDVVGGVSGALIGVVLKLGSLVNAVFGQEWSSRPLTPAERDLLRRIYRGSIAFYNVRVVDGASGVFSVNDDPFTVGNTIYMKSTPPADYLGILVHECCHVWQYQNMGSRYLGDAAGAQAFVPDAYNWQAALDAGARRWQDLNREAQAEVFRDAYRFGRKRPPAPAVPGDFFLDDPVGDDVSFVAGGRDNTDFARASTAWVRGDWSWRPSSWL